MKKEQAVQMRKEQAVQMRNERAVHKRKACSPQEKEKQDNKPKKPFISYI